MFKISQNYRNGPAIVGVEISFERPIYSTIVCPTSPLNLFQNVTIIEGARQGITVCTFYGDGWCYITCNGGTLVTHNAGFWRNCFESSDPQRCAGYLRQFHHQWI